MANNPGCAASAAAPHQRSRRRFPTLHNRPRRFALTFVRVRPVLKKGSMSTEQQIVVMTAASPGFVVLVKGSRLTRSLGTFATLALFAVSAVAQNIPAKLVLTKGGALVGKYAANGVQIYVCRVKGAANDRGFNAAEAELIDAQGRLFRQTL